MSLGAIPSGEAAAAGRARKGHLWPAGRPFPSDSWLSRPPTSIPPPWPGAGEERTLLGSGWSRGEGEASAVTERSPQSLGPPHHPARPPPAGSGRPRCAPRPGGSSPPRLARGPAGGTRGSLGAQGRWRRDPAPARRPAPIAAAGLVTRRAEVRARGQRSAAAGVAAGWSGRGGGWRVEIGAGGPRQSRRRAEPT